MIQSVRLRLVGWWRQNFNLLVERIAQLLRHVVVKTEPRDDSGLASKLPIGSGSRAVHRQAYNVLGAPEAARGNSINYQLTPFGQIHDERRFGAAYSHNCPSLIAGEIMLRAARGVES